MKPILFLPLLFCLSMTPLQGAQKTVAPVAAPTLTYADVADLALGSSIAAEVRIRTAQQLKGASAPGLAAGKRRYLLVADVMAVIRGPGGLPPRITYIIDLATNASGKWPKLPKSAVMVFGLPVVGKPDTIRLSAPDAQQPLTSLLSSQVRTILAEASTASAPPRVEGIGQAFHVAGSVPGEGETQIFLDSTDGRPVSLSVWRQPDTPPRWAVSLGEIVDEGAAPPARDTLAWYRLACFLPSQLPLASSSELASGDAAIAAEDYATVIAGLGSCPRTRGKQSPAQSS
jgi:hypothetical protein